MYSNNEPNSNGRLEEVTQGSPVPAEQKMRLQLTAAGLETSL